MNFSQSFSMALNSIFTHKVRSFLTMLGIVIGVSAVIILVSIVQGMQRQMLKQFEMMGTNRINVYMYGPSQSGQLTKDFQAFSDENGDLFEGFTPVAYANATLRFGTKTSRSNVQFGSVDYSVCNNYTIDKGRDITRNDIYLRNKVMVLGSYTAQTLFNYQDPVGKSVKVNGDLYTVVGVFESKSNNQPWSPDEMALIPYSCQRFINKREGADSYIFRARNKDDIDPAIREIETFLNKKGQQAGVYSDQQWIDSSNDMMNKVGLVLAGIAAISLLVGGIGIMNIMLVSVTERTREIGIRKAIGARRRDIISQFLIEASTISAFGGVIGILLGLVCSLIIGRVFFQVLAYPDLLISLGAFLFSISMGIFFGFYPASRASKMHPIDALRAE